jgi:hypothetical protein
MAYFYFFTSIRFKAAFLGELFEGEFRFDRCGSREKLPLLNSFCGRFRPSGLLLSLVEMGGYTSLTLAEL